MHDGVKHLFKTCVVEFIEVDILACLKRVKPWIDNWLTIRGALSQAGVSMLLVKIDDADVSLMLWKWTQADFKIPLRIKLSDSVASIFLEDPNRRFGDESANRKDPRQWVHRATILLQFDNPDSEFSQGLIKPSSEKGSNAAQKIYEAYLKCLETIVTYARLVLNVHSVDDWHKSSFSEFFEPSFANQTKVSWSSDGKSFTPIVCRVKKTKKINPIFKSQSLIWPNDWSRLQRAITNGVVLSPEVEELLKLRSKILWGEKRVSVVESTALMEMALKNVVNGALLKRGLSKNRLASLNEEAGLSIFLNFMLPLCLSNSLYTRALPLIQNIDRLRKIRNEIMHDNLPERAIDKEQAYAGVDSCIALITLLIKTKKWFPSQNHSR